MSDAFTVSYETRPEAADENQRLIEAVFRKLAEARPDGLGYAVFRLADGVTFVHVGRTPQGGPALPDFAAFREFQAGWQERVTGPAVPSGAALVGVYGFEPVGPPGE